MNRLNPSLKHNLLIGILISIWGFGFAFFIRPFDDGTISFKDWVSISIGFNLIAFISYGILSALQRSVYRKIDRWSLSFEIASIVFYYILYNIGTFTFYKSSLLNGGKDFIEFSYSINLKTALIVIPIIILARRYLIKIIPIKEDLVVIKGENKLDILKIKKTDLICISNAQNYVEIFFIQNGQFSSKLIRTSLKKLHEELDFLIQVHRSHLINPSHFRSWKNQKTISLTEIELPVSKSYKEQLLSL